jgi:hypothetical protein
MDLIADLQLTADELAQLIRTRADAVLDTAGQACRLAPIAGAFWADILFVTGRARTAIDDDAHTALSKASAALGYNPVGAALLCLGDADADTDPQVYADALGARCLVYLESDVATRFDADDGTYSSEFVETVTVTDFFGSLDDAGKKRVAWDQMKVACKQPMLR